MTSNKKEMQIANIKIGHDYKPFIIAEMSGNHHQSIDTAFAMIDAAAKAGANAIKLQTYTADTMTLAIDHADFRIHEPTSLWHGRCLHDLYHEAHTPWEWHSSIMEYAKNKGLICFSTPFDSTAVDFLETLNVPAYKIASFENTDVNLIRKVASTGKPILISTGMASLSELELIVNTLRQSHCDNFILLKCTSAYPANPTDANLLTIPHMEQLFGTLVGLSDHTLGIGVAVASVALGATVIEKHFCLSRSDNAVDSGFSLEPHELTVLVEETHRAWAALGRVCYQTTETEQASKQFRRSLYFVKDMQAGDIIHPNCIRAIRPGYGLPPKYYHAVLGKRLLKSVKVGDRMDWEILTNS